MCYFYARMSRTNKKKVIVENLQVSSYAAEGKALGRVEGKVVFVEGAIPGDVADVLLTKNKKDWAEGKIVTIKEFSPERVEPFCMHFGVCGGCKWQMLPYRKQLEYKQQEASDAFKRIGKIAEVPILPILGSAETIHYRNKLEFTFSSKKFLTTRELEVLKDGEWPGGALGYHVPRLYDKIIDIEECWLMDDVNNLVRNTLRDFCIINGYTYYDIKEHRGWLRNVVIRKATTDELMVNIIFAYDDKKEREKLMNHLLEIVPSITTLLYTINPKWNDTIYDLEPKIVTGKGYIIEKLENFRFKISPRSFFQTNTKQAEKLYNVVKDFAALQGDEIVYDLYSGTGSIGIFLSDCSKKIIGVDTVEDAIKDAKENAKLNNIEHADFFSGDVIEVCNDEFFNAHGRPDLVIVDPPRAGLHAKLINKLIGIAPLKIVYVSCNVATQARDLQLLSEKFSVERLQPVDMFPHTHHIECVAELKLR